MTNEHKDPSHVKAGWTPGPLMVVPDIGCGGLYAVAESEDARVHTASFCTKADATLYAAAPALAEALRRIAGNPHSDLFDQTNPDHVRAMADRYDNVVGIAEAALALARGEG